VPETNKSLHSAKGRQFVRYDKLIDRTYRPILAVSCERFAAFLHRAYIYDPDASEATILSAFFLNDGQTASF
jgi:hypothetical protein